MSGEKVLIANRGEIAVRIAQAASALGLPTVAVHPADDATCAHVAKADESVVLPGQGVRAYLDAEQILAAAHRTGCTAVHPGYGFLAESALFAEACETAGLRFVGPSSEVLALFGDKAAARAHVAALGVPVPAGTAAPVTLEEAESFLRGLGEGGAVMVKAVAGGGGHGMRPVDRIADLAEAIARCRSEAERSFGDERVYLEQVLHRARHIEVQVVGDGREVVHLWERDCSVQRRRQKLVEVAPAPALDPVVRAQLLDAALRITGSVEYLGLGTVEFLVSGRSIAFLEVNPRVQVEHTVTEEVTGVDLVEAQLRLALGASLANVGLEPGAVPAPRGMALQVRVNAESMQPDGTPQPGVGVLRRFQPPLGRRVRVDTHGYAGFEVTPRYDSLLAKVVVSDPEGELVATARRARRALREMDVDGVPTNLGFLQAILAHGTFLSGEADTGFVDRHGEALAATASPTSMVVAPKGPPGEAGDGSRPDPLEELPADALAVLVTTQGSVVEVSVTPGAEVRPGQVLVVVEAMKMEHPLTAPRRGTVAEVRVTSGDVVQPGAVAVVLEGVAGDDSVVVAAEEVDPDHIRPDLAEVQERHRIGQDEARVERVARRHSMGQRTARENIADLCDTGSFVEYGALVVAGQQRRRSMDDLIANTPADGMVTGIGDVDGAPAVVMSYDYTVLAGTQGLQNHRKTDRLIAVAEQCELPVVLFAEGGGGRPGDTDSFAVASLDIPTFETFARLSGKVPVVGIVAGYCFAGNAALAACCDLIIATEGANLGMGGPAMIKTAGLGEVAPRDVGPIDMQVANGVVDVLVPDEAAAVVAARRYLSYTRGPVPDWEAGDQRRMRHLIPENRLRAYDVRPIIELLADEGSTLELRPEFGSGIITVLARIEGRPVGVMANNSAHLGGAIDADAADKATRFLHLCDAIGLPVVSLCDTPGFMVGNDAERSASVRHFGRMFVAGSNLRVPMCAVILRKAYGLGPMAMTGGGLKAPVYTAAWPTGEFGGMGLEGAVELGYRRELDAIADPAARQVRYEELVAEMYDRGKAVRAATAYEIDDVIDPADTRRVVARSLLAAAAAGAGPRAPTIDPW